jgi:CheY-like chemotaxis protein
MGCDVATAEGGEEGILSCSRCKPHVVLCDLIMPHTPGFKVLEEVKKMGIECLFFLVSADIQENTRKKALELGAKDMLHKPITEKRLREVWSQYGIQ